MAQCTKTRMKKGQLCSGDLDKLIDIKERKIKAGGIGENASEVFTTVKDEVWAGIETPKGVAFFKGVNINETLSTLVTHKFYIYFDPELPKMENGNHYILFNDDKFKIIRVNNDNENGEFLVIETTNRGDDDKEAVNA
jgi:hypothetical protein